MRVRIAINGFGRIGRMVFRKAIANDRIDIVAINAQYPAETLAHLVKYDSVHGPFHGDVFVDDDSLIVDGKQIHIVNSRDPMGLPWGLLDIDIVIEATGKFRSHEEASRHLQAGARKVIITAPAKEDDITIVMGVNENLLDIDKHHVISNASCTTNCLAPVVHVLDEKFGILSGMMTTVHSYTNDQRNIDNPHQDLRRARACGESIIPTSTGAARMIGKILPQLAGKLTGMALRVPTPNVSLMDLVVDLKRSVTAREVNHVFQDEANRRLRGILGYTEEPLVSIDFNGDAHSSVIDGSLTAVIDENKVKVLAWYDNEWGYSCRVVDLVEFIGVKMYQKQKVQLL